MIRLLDMGLQNGSAVLGTAGLGIEDDVAAPTGEAERGVLGLAGKVGRLQADPREP